MTEIVGTCLHRSGNKLTAVVTFRLPAGGRPAATYLSCFAKKGMPKKATALAALRVPACASQKMGSSLIAQTRALLFPFSASHKRQLKSGMHVKNNVEIACYSRSAHFTARKPFQIINVAANTSLTIFGVAATEAVQPNKVYPPQAVADFIFAFRRCG